MLRLNAIGLFVKDMKTMVTFYRDVMQMETEWTGDADAQLYSGPVALYLFGRKDFEEMTSRSYTYPSGMNGTVELAFDLPTFAEVDQEYERVVRAGAVPVFPPTDEPWGQRTSYVADPEGNLIEISSFQRA